MHINGCGNAVLRNALHTIGQIGQVGYVMVIHHIEVNDIGTRRPGTLSTLLPGAGKIGDRIEGAHRVNQGMIGPRSENSERP